MTMREVAMSSTEHNLWLTANILGLVVIVAVAALLSVLVWLVKIIDRRVVQVRDTLSRAATATTTTRPRMFAVSQRLCSVEDMARSCIAILPAWRGRAAARR